MHSETPEFPHDEHWAEDLRPLLEKMAASKVDVDAEALSQHAQAIGAHTKALRRLITQFRRLAAPSPLPVPQLGSRAYRRLRRAALADCRARCGVRQK